MIKEYIPKGDDTAALYDLMKKSYDLLKDHPVNKARVEKDFVPPTQFGSGARVQNPLLTASSASSAKGQYDFCC